MGLDTDLEKIPSFLRKNNDPVYEFNRYIIEATWDHCVAYKPNLAFYEALGPSGWDSLHKTMEFIPDDHFTIADAKRGDIGNTSKKYAQAYFDQLDFDAITLSPYMGQDSISPYLEYENRWVILLTLTSNPGSQDFQMLGTTDSAKVFEKVLEKGLTWGSPENTMFVVGATQGQQIERVRSLAMDNFLLIPGIGAQGGSLDEVAKYGMNRECGLLVNASRSILYASVDQDFATVASSRAKEMAEKMEVLLDRYL